MTTVLSNTETHVRNLRAEAANLALSAANPAIIPANRAGFHTTAADREIESLKLSVRLSTNDIFDAQGSTNKVLSFIERFARKKSVSVSDEDIESAKRAAAHYADAAKIWTGFNVVSVDLLLYQFKGALSIQRALQHKKAVDEHKVAKRTNQASSTGGEEAFYEMTDGRPSEGFQAEN